MAFLKSHMVEQKKSAELMLREILLCTLNLKLKLMECSLETVKYGTVNHILNVR